MAEAFGPGKHVPQTLLCTWIPGGSQFRHGLVPHVATRGAGRQQQAVEFVADRALRQGTAARAAMHGPSGMATAKVMCFTP